MSKKERRGESSEAERKGHRSDSLSWAKRVTGTEGEPIALSAITGSWTTLSIADIPLGATLSDGNGHSFTADADLASVDVTGWTLGSLTITVVGDADFILTAVTGSGGRATESVRVVPAAPTLLWADTVTGTEGQAIALGALTARVGGQTGDTARLAALTISGLRKGVTISDGAGHHFTATTRKTSTSLLGWSLDNLRVSATTDRNLTLTVTATARDADRDVSATTVTEKVVVTPLAPIVTAADVAGAAGTPLALGLGILADGRPGDANLLTSVMISGLPEGAVLSDGAGRSFMAAAGAGAVDVLGWDIGSIVLNAPAGEMSLTIVATERDPEGDAAVTTVVQRVSLSGEVDLPPTVVAGMPDVGLIEAGVAAGVADAVILLSRNDPDGTASYVTDGWISLGGGRFSLSGAYGSVILDSGADTLTYRLDDQRTATDALTAGQAVTDVFTVVVSESSGPLTASAQVAFAITGANDAPIFVSAPVGLTLDDTAVADHFAALSGSFAASDAEGDALSIGVVDGAGVFGSLSVDGAGHWTFTVDAQAVDALGAGAVGSDSFSVVVSDGQGGSATQTVSVTVNGANDAPVFVSAPVALTLDDTAVADHFAALSGSFAAGDAEGDALSIGVVDGAGAFGTLSVDGAGHWTFTVDAQAVDALGAGAVGSDSFSVVVSDGQGGLATQPVSVTVNGANDAPVFVSAPVALTLTEGDSGASGQIDVSDAEGDGLSFAIDHGAGQYGTLQVDAFGAWSYVVDAGALSGLAAGTVVTDLFTVSADDGNGGIATQTVSISVPVPSAPPSGPVFTSAPIDLVLADTSAADSFAAIAGVVAATGAVGFAIDPTQSGQGVFGLFAIDATGAWSYTPDGMAIDGLGENETGVDQFTILADDGTGGMVSQIVTVTVTGANDAPIIDSTSSVLVAPNSAFVTRITGTDAEGTWPLGVSIAGGPDASLFTLVDDQLFFNTVPDYATDPHVYMVDVALSDGLLTTVQTVTVTLQAPDGAPFTAIDPGSVPALAGQITAAILGGMSGITVDAGSLTAVAGPESMMFYDGSLTPLGIGAGLLLTSGGMPGTSNTVGYFGYDNAMPGDPALDAVVNTVFNTLSYDATSLTFDFTVTDPTVTGVSMNVVFGSDEFPEWVDAFVDIGVVLMNGVNVAYFNNDPMAPLSVIGSNLSARYFIDNTGNLTTSSFDGVAVPGVPSTLPIEYDGVSPMMKIFAPVHQGLNTLQIGIADTGDHIYDSGLFISNLTATDTPTSGVVIDVPCTDGDDDLAGSDASESFDGKGGNDIIDAGGGNDIVKGGDGDDDLSGGDGEDFLDGGSGTNTLHGDAGDDRIQHVSGAGLDDIDGGTGRNTLIFAGAASTTAEVIDLSDPFVAQMLSDGSSFVNIAALVFHGGSGDDIVTGGAEADQLDGGLGDDVLSGRAGNDTIAGGDGTDTAVYGGDVGDYQVDTIGADLYRVTDLRGGAPDGVDTLSGIEQMQFLHGTFALSDLLTAGVTIQGTADDDVIEPGSTVAGQPMPTNQGDVIHGNGGDDHIQGGSGADTIWGDDGNDFLNGGDGNDVIMGGTGNDELRGDGGADRFVFASAADSPVNNVDVILDFHHAEGDLIDLSQIGAFSIVSAFTGSAGQLTIARSGDGYIVSGDTTGAGVASFAIQVDTQAMLTAANFQF